MIFLSFTDSMLISGYILGSVFVSILSARPSIVLLPILTPVSLPFLSIPT